MIVQGVCELPAHCTAVHSEFTNAIRVSFMQELKFAYIDLTSIISSLKLLEINHHFSKLHLEFTLSAQDTAIMVASKENCMLTTPLLTLFKYFLYLEWEISEICSKVNYPSTVHTDFFL